MLPPDTLLPDEEQTLRAEMEARIWKMIDELPERRREIFLMARRDGMSYKEIAEQTDSTGRRKQHSLMIAHPGIIL